MNMKPIMNKKGLYALVCALMGLTFCTQAYRERRDRGNTL